MLARVEPGDHRKRRATKRAERAGSESGRDMPRSPTVPRQIPFFIDQPRDDDAAEEDGGDESPDGAKRHGRRHDHQHCARVHRMADDGIRAARNHMLTARHLDDGRGVAVFPEHQEDDDEPHDDERVGGEDERNRDNC
jgi:hypothetical protein